jgi:hypothetical protein
MLYDGRSAEAAIQPQTLSDETWAKLKELLGLPERARIDFSHIVMIYGAWIEIRERMKPLLAAFASMGDRPHRDPRYEAVQDGAAERKLVTDIAECVVRYTGERPHHGANWLGALTQACEHINRQLGITTKIGRGTVEGALRGGRARRRKT